MKRTIYIYGLINSLTGQIFYVGQTKRPKARLGEHISKNKVEKNQKKKELIEMIFENGGKLIFVELDKTTDQSEAFTLESKYINSFSDLVNLMDTRLPSRKGSKASEDTKQKMFNSSPLKKKVAMIGSDNLVIRIFDSVRDAHRKTQIDHRSISAVASGSLIRKTAGGFKWQYL
jgi:hypothetical protein